jgi:superfamily I DNA and/or RNA helicase
MQEAARHSPSPEESRKLAGLEKYAAQTREDVYREFVTLDSLRRELELKRGSHQTHEPVAGSAHDFSHLQNGELAKGGQLKSDKEWQFDSLREVLAVEVGAYPVEPHGRDAWERQR